MSRFKDLRRAAFIAIVLSGSLLAACSETPPPAPTPAATQPAPSPAPQTPMVRG